MANAGENEWMIWMLVIPICLGTSVLLLYITFKPLFDQRRMEKNARSPHGTASVLEPLVKPNYKRVAITIDFSKVDSVSISNAVAQGGKEATYLLVHIVETATLLVSSSLSSTSIC